MRFPLTLPAIAVAALAIAACSAGQSVNTVTPPSGSSAASSGPVTVGAGTTQSAGTAGGESATLTYVGGTGTVAAASSTSAPAGTTPVSPSDIVRARAQASATSPNVYYLTISSTAGATLSGLPAVTLVLSTPAIGTFQEAQFGNSIWSNVPGESGTFNADKTAVSFPATKTAVTIPPGGSIFLAFYQGTNPAPAGPVGTNILNDPSFESGTAGAIGAPVTTTGWTQCTITGIAPGASAPTRALSTFTPTPGTTPGAVIMTGGTAVPVGTSTATPIPTQMTVPVNSGTHAAVFGGVFANFNQEDYRYNGLCQTVTVPNNPGIDASVFANGNDGTSFTDFEVDALNSSNQFLANLYEDPNPVGSPNPGSPGDTAYRQITAPSSNLTPFIGQTINLFVGQWVDAGNNAKFGTYYFVDDFHLTGTQ